VFSIIAAWAIAVGVIAGSLSVGALLLGRDLHSVGSTGSR